MLNFELFLIILISYLFGSIPFGLLFCHQKLIPQYFKEGMKKKESRRRREQGTEQRRSPRIEQKGWGNLLLVKCR